MKLFIINQHFWDKEERERNLSTDKKAHDGFNDLYPFGANNADVGEHYGVLADSGEIHCRLERTK